MPASRKTNKKLLLLKPEATFNVDSVPTAALDAILCEDPTYTVDATVLERNFVKPTWSRTAHAIGRKLAKIEFTVEVRNGGTAGTQSKFGRLLRACGMREVLTVGTSAVYTPSSNEADHQSATLYLYMDGTLHIMTGAYGTFTIEGMVNGYPKAKFTFTGQYYPMTDAALPANPVFETTKPVQVENANFAIGGFAAVISKFSFDSGVEVLPRLDANGSDGYNGTYIANRAPTGGIDPETTLSADQNFWARMAAADEVAINIDFGSAAGNSVNFAAVRAQYTGLTYQARDRIQTFDAGLVFNEATNAGDDDFTITLT